MFDGGEDDGQPGQPGPPVHPDDRLWRHPSEVHGGGTTKAARPRRPAPVAMLLYGVVVVAGVAGLWWASDQLEPTPQANVAVAAVPTTATMLTAKLRTAPVTTPMGVDCEATARGVVITTVVSSSAGEQAGLLAGDLIRSMDGATIAIPDDLSDVLAHRDRGDHLRVRIERSGSELTVTVTLR